MSAFDQVMLCPGFGETDTELLKSLLFGAGQVGVMFTPWDIESLFTDNTGLVAAAIGDQIGQMADASGNGKNATQSTLGFKPRLGRLPKTGRKNLLTYTEQFDNAVWTKTASSVSANAVVAPDNTTTADTIIENSASTFHTFNSANINVTSGETYTLSIYVKPAGRSRIKLEGSDALRFPGSAFFDVSTGSVVTSTTGVATIESVGNGWYRCIYKATSTQTGAVQAFATLVSTGTTINYLGDGASGLHIWGAQFQAGVVSAYQKVVTDYDVTERGQQNCNYILADGSNDGMQTPAVDFTGTNKVTIWVALTKTSDAAAGRVIETGTSYGVAGSFAIGAPGSGAANYEFAGNGNPTSGTAAYLPAGFTAPITNILTCTIDLSGASLPSQIIPWINGVLTQSAGAGVASGGNFTSQILNIFKRNAASQPFNGQIYGLIVGGSAYTAATKRRVQEILSRYTPGITLPQPLLQTQSATSGGTWGPRDGSRLLFLGDDAYQIGGWNGASYDTDWGADTNIVSNQVYKTSDYGVTWSRIRNQDTTPDATHFSPRHWFSSLTAENAMWLFQGDVPPRQDSDVLRSTDGITWTKQNIITPGYDGTCFSIPGYLNGVFYLAGGHTPTDAAADATNVVWKSEDLGVTWTSMGAAPWAARGVVDQLVNFNGKLWLISGGKHDSVEGNRVYYNDVWSFDGTTWTEELANGHKQFLGRLWSNAFAYKGWLYTSRGWSGVNNSTTYRSRDGRNWEAVSWALQSSHADSVGVHSTGVLITAGTWALNGAPPVNTDSPSYFAV